MIISEDRNHFYKRSPNEIEIIKAATLESIRNYIETKQDKELKGQTDFYKQILDCYKIWQRGDDNLVSTVLDMMVWSATNYGFSFLSKTKDTLLSDVLNYWAKNVNRGLGIDIPIGLHNVMREWYTEAWSSRLVVLYVIWGTMKYNNKLWNVPTALYIPNSYAIGVATSHTVGNNKYYFRTEEEIGNSLEIKDISNVYRSPYLIQTRQGRDRGKKYIPLKSNHSAYVSKIGTRIWEVLPVPYLYRKNTALLVKVKQALRKSDYRTAIGIINDILLLKKGSKELTEAGVIYGEKELTALNDLLKEKLAASGVLGTSYDTTAEHIHPDVQSLLNRDKYLEIDQDILASLGFLTINIENEKTRIAELNPKPLILEIQGCQSIAKNTLESQIVYEIVKRNSKNLSQESSSDDIIFYQKPMNIWISDEGKRLKRLLYDRGLVSKREAIEVLGETNYDVQKVQHQAEEKDGDIFFPPVIQNVEKDTEPTGGRPNDTNIDDKKPNNPDSTKKQNKKVINKAQGDFDCECLDCGKQVSSEQHCKDIKCPVCGGDMRRVSRPGKGQPHKEAKENYEEAPAKLERCVDKLMKDSRMIKKYPDAKERKSHAWAICQSSVMKKGLIYRNEKWSDFDKEIAEETFVHEMNLQGYYLKDDKWVKSEE